MNNAFTVNGINFFSKNIDWCADRAPFILNENEIHLWLSPLITVESALNYWPDTIFRDDVSSIESAPQLKRRKELATSLFLTRYLIMRYLDVSAKSITIHRVQEKKPEILISGRAVPFCLNWSHTDDTILFACARHQIGVDIERIRSANEYPRLYSLMKERMRNIPDGDDDFTRCWVSSEALYKGFGKGSLLDMLRKDINLSGLWGYYFNVRSTCLGAIASERSSKLKGYCLSTEYPDPCTKYP